jgi:hypothetical protein
MWWNGSSLSASSLRLCSERVCACGQETTHHLERIFVQPKADQRVKDMCVMHTLSHTQMPISHCHTCTDVCPLCHCHSARREGLDEVDTDRALGC